MLPKLTNLWFYLRSSLWLVPTFMVIGSVALSFLAIFADQKLQSTWLRDYQPLSNSGAAGARAVLSTIAGSMIGVTGIVFSITVVTLTLASSQFGPRLLRNFMRDFGNQIVLGTFIATFTYCLLVLRMVTDTSNTHFVPNFSVTLGILLALASIGVLIYFIHHTSVAIQADTVIADVSHDLHDSIDRLFPEPIGHSESDVDAKRQAIGLEPETDANGQALQSLASGYVQVIDGDSLIQLASQNDILLRLEYQPGDFVVDGSPLATVWPAVKADDELAAALNRAFVFGRQRTYTQDVGFALDQLVEIACRALSPGINDPFTAVTCIDRIGDALFRLAQREMPSPYRYDADARLRIIAPTLTFSHIADQAITPIRQYCRTSISVTLRLLEMITLVASQVRRDDDRQALICHANMIQEGSQEGQPVTQDRHRVEQHYQVALQALAVTSPTPSQTSD